jgi:hypothetical protein
MLDRGPDPGRGVVAMPHVLNGRFAFLAVLAVVGALSATVAFAVAGQTAGATNYDYCVNHDVASGQHCDDGNGHLVTANQAANYFGTQVPVCAGAVYQGSFYDDYHCGNYGFAEHCYAGDHFLYDRVHNSWSGSQHMKGTTFYGEQCP